MAIEVIIREGISGNKIHIRGMMIGGMEIRGGVAQGPGSMKVKGGILG